MNSTNQVTFPYDLDGLKLFITAEVTPGEPMTRFSPGCGDEIESVKVTGVREIKGKLVEYDLPEHFVDEMRRLWSIDDLIMEEIKEIRKHQRRAV